MSDFAVKVVRIVDPVEHHPKADRLSLIKILGFVCISAKLEDGSHRYKQGDLVVYVPEAAIVPDYLLQKGFWKDAHEIPQEDGTVLQVPGKGILAGPDGNRVHPLRLRGIYSQGILFPVESFHVEGGWPDMISRSEWCGKETGSWNVKHGLRAENDSLYQVVDGDDVSELLGIVKFAPTIPDELLGEVANLYGNTTRYDFNSIQSQPDLFTPGEDVVATEKINGTNCQIGYVPGLDTDDMFFDRNLYVCGKGRENQGLGLMNVEANDKNVYVRMLRKLLADSDNDFGVRMRALSFRNGVEPIRLFGEIFGPGVQKGYRYGKEDLSFVLFDVQVGKRFVNYDQMVEIARDLGLETTPSLYEGPFDTAALAKVRDGKDFMSKTNLREGIVIKSRGEIEHPYHGRKIAKWVSPDYAVKSTGEEFN